MRPVRTPPGPDQESVWDYPRPPRSEPVAERLRVELGGGVIADTTDGVRVLETSHPPVYYLALARPGPPSPIVRPFASSSDQKGRTLGVSSSTNGGTRRNLTCAARR